MKKRDLKTSLRMLVGRPPRRLKKDGKAMFAANRHWLDAPGVQGVGISRAVTDGELRDELVIKVYVDRKRPRGHFERAARADELIPKRLKINGKKWKVETDVEAVGVIRPQGLTERRRPLRPGIGISHLNGEFGSIGCFVRRRNDPSGDIYILSCRHVIGFAAPREFAQPNDAIIQPARKFDDGMGGAVVARFTEALKLDLQQGQNVGQSEFDAAIARIEPGVELKSAIFFHSSPPSGTMKRSALSFGDRVSLVGAVSENSGEIRDLDFEARRVEYLGFGNTHFSNLVACQRMSEEGDSGAPVFYDDGASGQRLCGLVVAASPTHSLFMPIEPILKKLDVELVTESGILSNSGGAGGGAPQPTSDGGEFEVIVSLSALMEPNGTGTGPGIQVLEQPVQGETVTKLAGAPSDIWWRVRFVNLFKAPVEGFMKAADLKPAS